MYFFTNVFAMEEVMLLLYGKMKDLQGLIPRKNYLPFGVLKYTHI